MCFRAIYIIGEERQKPTKSTYSDRDSNLHSSRNKIERSPRIRTLFCVHKLFYFLAAESVNELPDELEVPSEQDFNHFTLPFYFDRESGKYQHGRKNTNPKEKFRKIGAEYEIQATTQKPKIEQAQAYEDDKDDPTTIVAISVAIVVVAAILVAVLAVYCCKRCQYQTPKSNHGSVAYTSDDFEREEDVYLEDFGEGDFFEWPTPVKQQQQQQRPEHRQQHVIVEFSRSFSQGYCRLTTASETTIL